MKTIFLYGPPASGKTTLGRRLAYALKTNFIDLDAAIADQAGKDIPAIFASEGEPGFRDRESETLKMLAESNRGVVIALGGGTLLRKENREICERSGVIWCLEAPSEEELSRRFLASQGVRPLGDRARERATHYADFRSRIADSFIAGDSLVVVGSSIAAAVLPRFPVVADAIVAKLYSSVLSPVASSVSSVIHHLPSGERFKTPETVISLWRAFAAHGLGRNDLVAALGGGVTGDLTGFAAATWMRGIDWINVPTTLLAMVDASTGGKTGCDLPEGKNLAGAFHSPRLVVIDSDFLKTLSPALIADGRAEMIKHEIIGKNVELRVKNEELRMIPSAEEIAGNLIVKVNVVKEDPYETKGRRILLNCGHTVGHAVEKLSDYTISHGSAVAIGCVEEARLAVRLGLAQPEWPEELAAVFAAAGLPTALPDGLDFEKLKPVMRGDKKHAGDTVTFALPCGWGDVRATPVDLTD